MRPNFCAVNRQSTKQWAGDSRRAAFSSKTIYGVDRPLLTVKLQKIRSRMNGDGKKMAGISHLLREILSRQNELGHHVAVLASALATLAAVRLEQQDDQKPETAPESSFPPSAPVEPGPHSLN